MVALEPLVVQPPLPVERLYDDFLEIVALRPPAENFARPVGASDDDGRVTLRRGPISTLKSTPETFFTTSITSLTVAPWP